MSTRAAASLVGLILCVPFWVQVRTELSNAQFIYDVVLSHHTLAVETNDLAKAKEELALLQLYLKQQNLASGNTAITLACPECDLDLFYQRIEEAKNGNDLALVKKLKGTVPEHMHTYPHQGWYAVSFCVTLGLCLVGVSILACLCRNSGR